MRNGTSVRAALVAIVIVVLALPAVAGTGQATNKAGDIVTISSKAMQYTVAYPSTWVPALTYTNEGRPESMVFEQARFRTPEGGEISIAVWDASGIKTLDAWLETNFDILNLADRKVSAHTVAKAAVEGRVYFFDNSGGQAANQTKTYFMMDGKIFEISYYMSDSGAATEQYWTFVDSIIPGVIGADMLQPAEFTPELQETSKVYSCGGYSDTCYCAAWNPFPCCSNGGNCTWWGWDRGCCNWGIDIPPRGNANTWDDTFHAYGYRWRSCSYPAVGYIAVRNSGTYGHVAWVTAVSGTSVQVSEQNCWGGYGVFYTWYDRCFFDAGYFYPW